MNGICLEVTGIRPDQGFIFTGGWEDEVMPEGYPDRQLNKALEEVLKQLGW